MSLSMVLSLYRYRQKQLIRQLPAHDIDILYCNDLNEDERKQMELFVRMRREKSVGRGEVKMRESGDLSAQWVSWEPCHSHDTM